MVREARGLLQGVFWRRIDVKQARGNRYKRGNRDVPDDVRILLHLAYGPEDEAATLLDALRSSGFGALKVDGGLKLSQDVG